MTRSKMVSMNEGEKMIGEEKQQLVTEPAIDPVVEPLSGTEEEVEVEDDHQKEIPIIDKERHLARFLDIFKKLEIIMPFGEALQQMPLYAKFLKDMLTRKNKYIHSDTIVVEGNYSAVIQRILQPKHKDPGSVTIPCSIGEVFIGKALIDLGASINLMPLSMCQRLGKLEIMPTRMTLQLADRSITKPYGVIEDVLVRVKHLIFPVDFIVMDIEEDAYIPLILGRPFMSTASYVVDIGKKKLEIGIEDQHINFDLFNEERKLLDQNVCLQVKEFDEKAIHCICPYLASSPYILAPLLFFAFIYIIQMASRKRKASASVSQARYDRSKFTSQDAWDRYADNILGRKILPERNGSIDVAIVKEFYASLYDPEDKSPKQVRVQGHLIKFNVDTLNTFLKTPVVIEEGESLPAYSSCPCPCSLYINSIYLCSSFTTTSSSSSRSLRLEIRAFLVYAAEPASRPYPDHVEFAGCGPAAASYKCRGVSSEVIVQEDVAVPEPSPQPKPEPSAPVLHLPLSQDPSSTPALDLNEHAQDH
ncbi:hypothetical protein D0Y65_030510 [Glycine soja]|uniref:Aspartic peptidase DDI1-type domain-containing protein n=1 Tax=Glycine soja TaxID=3848 RepID=A0A445I3W5_GLYSO|nr:hypothetical protein D0Y65_030510 [Glycine soja]